jgi:hypothetical protein
MVKRIVALCFWIVIQLIGPQYQQSETATFNSVKVSLWPEYDRRAVLVNYQLELSPSVPLPFEIQLRVPQTSMLPFKLSFQAWDGIYYDMSYTTEIIAEERWLSFSVPSRKIIVEYYDSALIVNSEERSYDYMWPADYSTDAFEMTIQLPALASQLRVKPQFGLLQVNTNNLVEYSGSMGTIPKNAPFSVTLTYEKPTDVLTQLLLPLHSDQSISLKNLQGRLRDFPIMPAGIQMGAGILIAVLLILLIVISGIMVTLMTTYRQPRIKTTNPTGIEKAKSDKK